MQSSIQQSTSTPETPFHLVPRDSETPPPPSPAFSPAGNPPQQPTRAGLSTANPYACLPVGWSTAVNPTDGRIYYWEVATGKTSWTHPNAPQQHNSSDATPTPPLTGTGPAISMDKALPHQENPLYASKRPDSHECNSVVGFLCCPILGIVAVYHSLSVNRRWNQGRYGDAVHHARQAPKYATLAIIVGVVFWIYWFFFREESNLRWEWPDWDFNWGD